MSRRFQRMFALAALSALTILLPSAYAASPKMPFAAEVAIEEFEAYRADIDKKAREAIGKKRELAVAKLKAEAAKQSKSGNAEVAAEILKTVGALEAEVVAEMKAIELANRRWTPMFEPDNLPSTWVMPKEPDGGWSFTGGELEMQSLLEYAPIIHEAPEGDLLVRAKVKLVPNGEGEKEKQAGIGFIGGEDNMLAAIAQAPGVVLAFGKIPGGGAPLVEVAKSNACQNKFSELQIAWVGKRFMVFARGKLVHDCEVSSARLTGSVALLANNAKGHFKDVEMRVPDREDLERLKAGRAID